MVPDRQNGHKETPLPATLRFVLAMGSVFVVLWFAMYFLLRVRW